MRGIVLGFTLIALAACRDSTAPDADLHQCDFVKQSIWVAGNRALPVPDSLLQSNTWDLPAPGYLGLNTTYFTPLQDGCKVIHL